MFPPPPARSPYSVLIRVRGRGRGRVRTRLRVGVGVGVKVGFRDSVGVQNGQILTLGAYGAHGPSGAFGAHGLLRVAPLATNCWPKAPRGGGGGTGSWRPRTRGVGPPVVTTMPEITLLAMVEHHIQTNGMGQCVVQCCNQTECTITVMTEALFPSSSALHTPNPPFWTTKTAVPKFPQNGDSTPTPRLDKAVHAQGGGG